MPVKTARTKREQKFRIPSHLVSSEIRFLIFASRGEMGLLPIHCIVNPVAGRGRAAKKWPMIFRVLEKCGYTPEVYVTTNRGHARVLSQDLANRGVQTIVGIGGDGTFSEIVNGIAGTGTQLAVIPCGTGNDFARTLRLPLDPLLAAALIPTFRRWTIDLGRVNGQYYLNVAGVGLDAEVAREINQGIKFLSGAPAYLLAVAKVLLTFKSADAIIRLDGKEIRAKGLLIAVGNGRCYGGGMMITPAADPADGLLDICIVEDLPRPQFLLAFPQIFSGRHVLHPRVKTYRATQIEIETPGRRLTVHADGEIVGQTPIRMELAPAILHLLAPGDMPGPGATDQRE